ncbi:uncharacterized protein N7482_005192 [Penicillium canariense]|uniref:Conserved oligomeric Golgi complex subunit 1 n=1 Tax=Penicillium canariense TaxID=189055 RepID=A0A9W9I3F1_9EURO|nr:uncharacterized protein N7482_005192 [Penicillium canariense]KAJ5166411.1 hypothetical protein N7482_005192 [Penicillium canariense]
MAPEAPDPESLKSWHDAFQYPIPTVRRVEQELRRDIASNKEKLRALVGTRYRELVGTAETIVEMNKEIQVVEATLTDVGRRCNPRLVEKKHLHARQMKSDTTKNDADKHAFGAQLALLHRCTTSITRLLRKRASLLLVAKILVVSRLLHKTLSQHPSTPPFLDDLRNQLASLRRTLLKRIDKKLASANGTEDIIIESLAAFCLATSSSSDDAIHHLHQVRLDVITSQLDSGRENIPKALRLFIRTLQTSKVLRARQFADVLSKLKARPILSDPEIRNLDGLEIEVLGRWAVPEVNNFTPWIKLSELNRSEGVQSIKEWSLQAFEKFAEGSQRSLAHSNDFHDLLSLRADTIELWLSSWGSTITHRSVDVFERLRNIFNEHLKRVLATQVQTVDDIANQISSSISIWESSEHVSTGSLWDSDLIIADFSNGAAVFKQTVADRLLGRDDDVSSVLKKYQAWLASIQELNESIEALRRLKWTDILVSGEVEDEDIDVAPRLNHEDPRILSDSLHAAVRQAFEALQTSFSDSFKAFGSSHLNEKARFLLRLVRLVRREIPAGFVAEDLFSGNLVPELQSLLAAGLVAHTGSLAFVPASNTNPETNQFKTVPSRSLWEGEPSAPVQPSPSTFKFLRRLTGAMDESGPDLWDPSTVQVLKDALKQQLQGSLTSTLQDLESWKILGKDAPKSDIEDDKSTENPEHRENGINAVTESTETESEKPYDNSQTEVLRDWKLQLYFDALYLANMLGDPTQLADVVERIQKSADPSVETVKATRKLAQKYWKQTELLFGLLAER